MNRDSMTWVDVSVVVPVYRSENILPTLVEQFLTAMRSHGCETFELILVNDASPDQSWEVIKTLAISHPFVVGICLRKNVGQHNATMAGLHHSRGNIVVIMDDDLQHPPEAIGSLVEAIKSGHDVCYTRYLNRQHQRWKKIGSWINDRAATMLLNKPPGLYLSSFKALHRTVVEEVIKYDGPYAYVDGIILDITRSITVIDIQHGARISGKGNYNLRRSLSLWLKMATSFSVFPLRVATVLGMILTLLSLSTVALVILNKLRRPDLPAGWASLIAAVLLVGGLQTFCLGVVGEYLGRAYLKINKKPQFVIRETLRKPHA